MHPSSTPDDRSHPEPRSIIDFRLVAGLLLLGIAAVFTCRTIDGLDARRRLRMELAEISHVRYGLLNVDLWMKRIVPILDARIDALDLKARESGESAALRRESPLPPAGQRERENERAELPGRGSQRPAGRPGKSRSWRT